MKLPTLQIINSLKPILLSAVVALCLLGMYFAVQHSKTPSDNPVRMQFSDTTDKNAVKQKLHVDDRTARDIVTRIERIHDGATQPNVSYYVTAPNLQTAADRTAEQIKNGDTNLPKEATAKSDRTVVTADEQKHKVDVYKINLRNNHKIKAGGTYIDGKPYLSVGYQAGRIEGIAHIGNGGRAGGTILYTIKEW
ncbi:hypothetical protein [Anaeroglobus geminatus]|uniref:Uncharacterized protein n=1 Tax=Anaeroglobus geminatus F0357 TaxID=861450 RepID=G9YK64_9FIRM|nr:hypothetical protein [Anaeroglobus geminatus]EHM37738.1 hypothetical protein HMPREF0080_02073 [Anaeroglobus geminatus F0357]